MKIFNKNKSEKIFHSEYMTAKQSAKYMGVSYSKFFQLKAAGLIPFIKHPGCAARFRMSDLDKIMNTNTTTSKIYEVSAVI